MTAPRYAVCVFDTTALKWPEYHPVAHLPSVPVGTSIRLEFTADGWVDRGRLLRCPVCTDRQVTPTHWVDAPSTETTE
jgi:hypothetical protein